MVDVTLNWDSNPANDGKSNEFEVRRGPTFLARVPRGSNPHSYVDATAALNTAYAYQIYAVNAVDDSLGPALTINVDTTPPTLVAPLNGSGTVG